MQTRTPLGQAGFPARQHLPGIAMLALCVLGLIGCSGGGESPREGSQVGADAATLEVRVRNVVGQAIAGATVTVTVEGLQHVATTGAEGEARFVNLPTQSAAITVAADGFEPGRHTDLLARGMQLWEFTLDATGAWATGRAIVLGATVLERAADGTRLTFSVDVSVVGGENPEPIMALTAADFTLQTIDCGWGGPRDCASDAAGNAAGVWGNYSVEGTASGFELRPAPGRRPYLAGVLVERFGNGDEWYFKGPALKSLFGMLGADDAIGLASVEFDGTSITTNIQGPFTSDGSVYLDVIDRLGGPAGDEPLFFQDMLLQQVLDAIRWTAAGADDFPGKDPTLLISADLWLSLVRINEAVALARANGVRISLLDPLGWGSTELALRTGGFVSQLQDLRQYGTILGVSDAALSGDMPFYRMRFTLTGGAGTFVPGGNVRVYMHIDTPATIVNRGASAVVDVTIPE